MASNTNSKVWARIWLTPDQVDGLRNACYEQGAEYLQQRNDAIIALMYETGLRVGELVAVAVRGEYPELHEVLRDRPNLEHTRNSMMFLMS